MTYEQFTKDLRSIADNMDAMVKDSQLVSLDHEMAEDDTMLIEFENEISELVSNVTGIHGEYVFEPSGL